MNFSDVLVDFSDATVVDNTAIDAIESLADRYIAVGKRVNYRGISKKAEKFLFGLGNLFPRLSEMRKIHLFLQDKGYFFHKTPIFKLR